MKRFVPIMLLFAGSLMIPATAAAQNDSPEEPEIVLPTALLRVDSIPFERVEAVLPGGSQIVLPPLDIPLPSVHEMDVQPRVLMPDSAEAMEPVESSVFSTGIITAGSKNLIEGQLGVFKLGQDPRFRLTFNHQGLDGYGRKPAGTGYFRSRQDLNGWLGSAIGPLGIESSLGFSERQEGLQQASGSYYSTVLRFLQGGAEVEARPDELIGVYGLLDAGTVSRRFTVSQNDQVPPSDKEDYLLASVRLAIELPAFELSLAAEYGYQDIHAGGQEEIEASHDSAVVVRFDAHPRSHIDIFGNAGAQWLIGDRFEYPFEFGLNYRNEGWLEVSGRFGRRTERQLLHGLWQEMPLLDMPETRVPDPSAEWFVGMDSQADFLQQNLRVQGGVEYTVDFMDRMLPGAFSEVADDEDFPQTGFEWGIYSGSELKGNLDVQYQINRFLRLQLGYNAAVPLFATVASPVVPLHHGVLGLTFGTEDGMYGGEIDTDFPFYSRLSMPFLDISGFAQVTDGVLLRAGARDVLSPFLEGERYQFGSVSGFSPFIEPGIRFMLSAEITL